MPSLPGGGGSFDSVAALYEKLRPSYVPALYDALVAYCPVGPQSCALEVGIGSGQASLPLLQRGCRLTAVEPGEQFSQRCREKFADFPGFSVLTGRFEDLALPEDSFDLVYSATAFHWVPEELGYPKVLTLLKPGGAFARFANRPFRDKGNPALAEEIDDLYRRYYYPYYHKEPQTPKEFGPEEAAALAALPEKYGFCDCRYELFRRQRCFSAQEYCALLGTYSDHIALPQDLREEFFAKIQEAIRRHGGTLCLYDTLDLELARKPL